MIAHPSSQQRIETILAARRVLSKHPVFLDTETTGLGPSDEVVQIAVVNEAGEELLNTLVKPGEPIPASATAIHGITNADVSGAPRFDDVWHAHLRDLLTGTHLRFEQPICIYNGQFDLRLIRQSLLQYDLHLHGVKPAFCVMTLYAEYYGEWDDFHGNYRWQKQIEAARQCGLPVPDDLHSAIGDARLCLAILRHMAQQEVPDIVG